MIIRQDYRPPPVLVDRIELSFDLALPVTRVTAKLAFRCTDAGEQPLVLDGERQDLVELLLDGERLPPERYVRTAHSLTIVHPPAQGELTIVTLVQPAAAMEGLVYVSDTFVTHCEPAGFRRITYFPDRPDVLARYRCTLAADPDRYPVLLSNGNLTARGRLADGRHFVSWDDPYPKASYLFALVAGRFEALTDHFVTRSGRKVALTAYATADELSMCGHGMGALKRAMAWDEQAYDREYDLDLFNIAVMRNYPGGAMENKSLNLYAAESFLARPECSTDAALQWVEAVVAHEYLHNWSGNRVGCRDWFELSLKEGFTIFRQQEFMASRLGAAETRIEAAYRIREFQFAEDDGALAHAVRPQSYAAVNNLYTHTVYEKGAEVIRMMQTLVGESAFRAAATRFFDVCDGTATTIDRLVTMVEEVSGCDLRQFRRWYDVVGGVLVQVSGEYDARTERYTLTVSQHATRPDGWPGPLHIPLRVALIGASGRALTLRLDGEPESAARERVLQIRAEVEHFVFIEVAELPTPSLFRGFSAPVRVASPLTDAQLVLLASHDDDAVTRWDAAQALASRALLCPQDEAVETWAAVFRATLERSDLSASLAARMLELPSERQLGQRKSMLDIDGLRAARRSLAVRLATRFRDELRTLRETLAQDAATDGGYGERRLRNLCLWYLMQAPQAHDLAACWTQFRTARRMEDTSVALQCLVDRQGDDRDHALDEAYRRWLGSPPLVDQWFAVQAASAAEDCALQVQALTKHESYSIDNGTRLKAFLDAFARNQSGLHHRSGAGYAVIEQVVLGLNAKNPRLAARFLKHLDGWTRLDAERADLVRATLQRILATVNLADDLHEIASRCLHGSQRT